jgi:hypothetical protein
MKNQTSVQPGDNSSPHDRAMNSSETKADSLNSPALLTRRYDRADGSHGHEVWCPWCEKSHYHGEGEGQRAAHCSDHDGRSPLAATGYEMRVVQHARASDAASRFPTGRGFVGKRRFWRSIGLSAAALRREMIAAIFAKSRKSCRDLAVFKIPDARGAPGARVEFGEFGGRLGWSVVYSDGEASYGDHLASLISEMFGIPWGVATVHNIEASTGMEFDAPCALAIAAAVDDWRSRGAPKNAGRCA